MIKINEKKDCVGCNACVQRCPKQCISMDEDVQGFLYPNVDLKLCIDCGLCEKVCPVINQAEPNKPEVVFAARNLNEEERMKSSSGGVFYALAKSVINGGGVVFGAKFNDKWEVIHGYAETLEEAKAFQGSKYVQSRIDNSFSQAEKFLKEGRTVLFSGTPCQLAGLRLFLRKPYENLLGVDVVCHGVPSPLVWRDYLNYITRPKGASVGKNTVFQSLSEKPVITGISFRDKRLGWEKFGFSIRISATKGSGKNSVFQSATSQKEEQELLFEPLNENLFLQIFLKDLDLRPSCYECPAKCGKSLSDITLADFWGVRHNEPTAFDEKGVSLVLVNNPKLINYLKNISTDLVQSDYNLALKGNPSIEHSAKIPKLYRVFWHSFYQDGFENKNKIVNLIHPSLFSRALDKFKHLIFQNK